MWSASSVYRQLAEPRRESLNADRNATQACFIFAAMLTALFRTLIAVVLAAAHLRTLGVDIGGQRQVVVGPQSVALTADRGATIWRWQAPQSTSAISFAAAGDLNGDGVPEIVVIAYVPMHELCGSTQRLSAALWVLDGRTGRASRFGPQLDDICFTFPQPPGPVTNPGPVTYPQVQWAPGSVSVANESMTAFPVYATVGYLLHSGVVRQLVFPSTPAYDLAFPGCMKAPGSATCYVPYSHIAYLVWIPGGQLVLTSSRAMIYAGGQPVQDLTWTSGTTDNGGRNKGFLFTFLHRGRRYAELIGGCTVANEQLAIRLHELPSSWTGPIANCSIHHHLEWFALDGLRIAAHVNHYYGYIHRDGFATSRLEAPAPAIAPLDGRGTHWTVFNRFDGSNWVLETLPDPTRPNLILQRLGWFAWGMADLAGDGRAQLLATHGSGYFLPWSFDVLEQRAGQWRTLAHVHGLLPSEVATADLPDQDFAGQRDSLVVRNGRLLVETKSGLRYWLSLHAGGQAALGDATASRSPAGTAVEKRP